MSACLPGLAHYYTSNFQYDLLIKHHYWLQNMSDLDTIQIVQRQDSAVDSASLYQSIEYKIDTKTYVSPFGNKFSKENEQQFAQFVYESELALDFGQKPKLSAKGTSGCYFMYSRIGVSSISGQESTILFDSTVKLVLKITFIIRSPVLKV